MEETLRQYLIDAAKQFEAATGVSAAGIGKKSVNDNTFFARLSEGQGFTVKTYDRVIAWLSANWPDDAEWPAGVPRPVPLAEAS